MRKHIVFFLGTCVHGASGFDPIAMIPENLWWYMSGIWTIALIWGYHRELITAWKWLLRQCGFNGYAVRSKDVRNIRPLTRAEFDSLEKYEANTVYLITSDDTNNLT